VFATDWIVFGRNESKIFIEVINMSNKRVITYKAEVLLFFKCNSHSPVFFVKTIRFSRTAHRLLYFSAVRVLTMAYRWVELL